MTSSTKRTRPPEMVAALIAWRSKGVYKGDWPDRAYSMALNGANDTTIANYFGVSQQYLWDLYRKKPELREAVIKARSEHFGLAKTLLKKAKGYTRKSVKPMTVSIGEGRSTIVDHPVVEYFPPDMKAIEFFLKNRDPEHWSGTPPPAPEQTTPVEELEKLAAALDAIAELKRTGGNGTSSGA